MTKLQSTGLFYISCAFTLGVALTVLFTTLKESPRPLSQSSSAPSPSAVTVDSLIFNEIPTALSWKWQKPASTCNPTDSPRYNRFTQNKYVDAVLARQIGGWMSPSQAILALLLSRHQHDAGICGAVVEIGVHHGLYFTAIMQSVVGAEKAMAIDVFEDQHLNLDRSGSGSYKIFTDTLTTHSIRVSDVDIVKSSSLNIKAPKVVSSVGGVRFFSVDGGHDAMVAYNDLVIAGNSLVDGGIISVDDWYNPNIWAGVTEGVFRYMSAQQLLPGVLPPLIPFLHIENKLLLTTPGYHQMYLNFLKENPFVQRLTSQLYTAPVLDNWEYFHIAANSSVMTQTWREVVNS
ncbi:hypothetical protein M427DRAFT_66872 [Gonapodya prolifera JEL478]|uniref:S-adenosyl-L-methionine-dependent methyltransferase n=1 Tax=Gonapodya prolifera (strain JEL478) TaxID=1344416 RepID=A0A139ASS5_GONPJ|nr:hypothetical protein M427DRAFT_66872 [Gonapodya prolifera JEL478]|eukprot:KXS19714.1 hypothetical protein M427DRAFT_66872 [Gonapodya prolifera JEL478]